MNIIGEMHYGVDPRTDGTYFVVKQAWIEHKKEYGEPFFEIMRYWHGAWCTYWQDVNCKVLAWAMLPNVSDVLKDLFGE